METEATENKETILYDADAPQRFAFDVTENGEKFETAHVFKALTDEKYLEYVKGINASADEDDSESNESEILAKLWREQIQAVENLEVEEGKDFRDVVDTETEVVPSIKNFLAVVVVETEKIGTGKRKGTTAAASTEIVTTEAYFNGAPVRQTHVLKSKKSNEEFSKKYARIEKNQWKTEITKGLRRQPKVEFFPQIEAKAALYDQMCISTTGFAGDKIPVRFKSVVVDHIFAAATLDPKK